jgi:Flp pilus assembly protein TadG
MTIRPIRRVPGDQSGAAAIELALIAPVIAGMALVSFEIWRDGSSRQDARAALDAGVEYYMAGGLEDPAARSVAYDAWRNRPQGATVSSARNYQCGETAAQEGAVCSGGRTAATYVSLTATGSGDDGEVINETKVVRVR